MFWSHLIVFSLDIILCKSALSENMVRDASKELWRNEPGIEFFEQTDT